MGVRLMTRRERLEYILENHPEKTVRYFREDVLFKLGFDAFSDEALEMLTRKVVSSYKWQQRRNREHIARKASA